MMITRIIKGRKEINLIRSHVYLRFNTLGVLFNILQVDFWCCLFILCMSNGCGEESILIYIRKIVKEENINIK